MPADKFLEFRNVLEIGFEQANFLHKVHLSILDPDYVKNDISFINWAFPDYLKRLGKVLDSATANLMLEFYENVPEHLRSELTWHPNADFRRLARGVTKPARKKRAR